jgi:hypothetical protein
MISKSKIQVAIVEKWKKKFLKIWQYHFNFLLYRIHIKKIPKNCFTFLGYTLDIQNKIVAIQAKMLEELFRSSLINKKKGIPTI